MKTQTTNQQNQKNGKVKVLFGVLAAICVLAVSGCQETATVTKSQGIPLQRQSACSDKVLTLAVFPENETVTLMERQSLYLVGTQSYADKLMATYEDSDIPTLPTRSSRLGYENLGCVPLLMITY
jgi:hypothetical protein